MKKMLLAGLGLSGLLASCGGGGAYTPDPVRNLALLSYQSQYTLPTAYTDTRTGTTYAAGSSIICSNLTTRLEAVVDWDGMADQFGVQLEGRDTGATKVLYSNTFGDIYAPAAGLALLVDVAPQMAPLSVTKRGLSAQAISVQPVKTFTVKGATFLNVMARSSNGTLSNEAQSVQALPVADCTL